jgi:hypothetical protein
MKLVVELDIDAINSITIGGYQRGFFRSAEAGLTTAWATIACDYDDESKTAGDIEMHADPSKAFAPGEHEKLKVGTWKLVEGE